MDKKKTGIYAAGGILLFLAGVGFSQLFIFAASGRVDPQQIVVAFKNPVCTAPTVINCPPIRKLPEMRPNRVQPERRMPRPTICGCPEQGRTMPSGCCGKAKAEMSPLPKCDCSSGAGIKNRFCGGPQASVWPEPDADSASLLHLKSKRRTA